MFGLGRGNLLLSAFLAGKTSDNVWSFSSILISRTMKTTKVAESITGFLHLCKFKSFVNRKNNDTNSCVDPEVRHHIFASGLLKLHKLFC
jgi:hypothetical protein